MRHNLDPVIYFSFNALGFFIFSPGKKRYHAFIST